MSTTAALFGVPLNAIFLVYVGVIAASASAVLLRYLPIRFALAGLATLALWLGYAGVVGRSGVVGDPTQRPPGIVLLVGPILLFTVLAIGRSSIGRYLASRIPLALILAFQTVRVGVEITLSSLHHAGLTSRLMTLPGGNVELLVGLSAPIIALISSLGARSRPLVIAWNVGGLLSLANVAARAVLTSPGPLNLLHTETPTVAMGVFPFGFIPGFMAPLAMILHILAFRALSASRTAPETTPALRTAGLDGRRS